MAFLENLKSLSIKNHTQLIMFDLQDLSDNSFLRGSKNFDSALFLGYVKYLSFYGKYPEFIRNAMIFDASKILSKKEYFILDGHINQLGHERIAKEILSLIDKKNKKIDILKRDKNLDQSIQEVWTSLSADKITK